jgi:uncharacterized membrane protein YccC
MIWKRNSMHTSIASPRLGTNFKHTLATAREPLLFGVRLWASVCLALFVAYWLELDNPFWAGTSAAIVCQPQLGAALRKGWFRMIGTVVGATIVVVLTACFPQDRIGFLGLLAVWGGLCAYTATVLRNFASYSAALAGYTVAIIAADNLGATGGANADVFLLSVTRASEICIGILSAGVVLAGTDLGGARRRLAKSFANLSTEITAGFTRMLALAKPQLSETEPELREFLRRVITLDPTIDQALGESGQLRYHSTTLQAAVYGLFTALDGWRGIATRVSRLPTDREQQEVDTILRSLPSEFRSAWDSGSVTRWMTDPLAVRRSCEKAAQRLFAMPASTPSLRLLADETVKVLGGIERVMDGLALLVDVSFRPSPGHRWLRPSVPDLLPALVNAGRAFVAISVAEFFWIATAWPNGAYTIVFVAIVILLISPKGDLAYSGAVAFTLGTAGSVLCAAFIKFAVLPGLETFPAFCAVLALYFIPIGFAVAQSRQPTASAVLTAMAVNFGPPLAATNQMSYDTQQFYNLALAIFVGCATAALSFRLIPPISSALRARRLLASALRDLGRLAIDPLPARPEDWEGRMCGRLEALPDQAEPLQRAQLLAALSMGGEIIQLRRIAPQLAVGPELDAVLEAFAHRNGSAAIARLRQLDLSLASCLNTEMALRARGRIIVLVEALSEHLSYFNARAIA